MKLAQLLFFILIQTSLQSQTLDTIIYNGDSDEYINIVILGDGYTMSNLNNGKLNTDGLAFANALLNESPYQEYADFFNFFIIKHASFNIGADHPATATDVVEPVFPVQDRNTVYHSTFDVASIHRLLAPAAAGVTQVNTDLLNLFPNFDQIILLVNDPNYGGSGGTIATASLDASANEIAIHEMGHSFADLADEYYAGDVFAAERANMTMNNNTSTVKWKNWLSSNGVGIYPHTCTTGNCASWYKPHNNCKMQFLGSDFCSVCKEAIIDVMYGIVDPFQNKIPDLTSLFSFNGSSTLFGSDLIMNSPNTMVIEWYLNGNLLANRTNSKETFTFEDFPNFGGNVLQLRVTDQTPQSRTYLPGDGYTFTLSWNVSKVDLCTSTTNQFDYLNSFGPGSENGQPTSDDFNWSLGMGSTPTANTGPSGAIDGSTYLFIEADGNTPAKTAEFRTECFDLTDLNRPVFYLYHHLFGADIGSLKIDVSVDAGRNWTNAYIIQGNQGDNWKQAGIDLQNYISPYTKFRIVATTTNGNLGDIAIDQLEIVDLCPDNRNITGVQNGSINYKALNMINSTSTVNFGTVLYQAGTAINLNQGFQVNAGANFTAQFGGCN